MTKLNCPDFDGFAMCTSQPFKKYIQEHLDEFKVEESKALPVPGPTKESRDIPVISNKRLLI